MSITTYPSPNRSHRRTDQAVHIVGLAYILIAAYLLLSMAANGLEIAKILAVVVYLLCALASNLASATYHFAAWHTHRKTLRRVDHSAIYLSITGSFTPFFILANTTWTLTLLWVCWGITIVAIWQKLTSKNVKSRWSTALYIGLSAVGFTALPDLANTPTETVWCIIAGGASYLIGTVFYVRKSMPFRYATWHMFVNFGGIFIFAGIWLALS